MSISVRKIDAEECKPLRHQVLWPHIPLEKDCVIDIDLRIDAIHLGAFISGKIVGVCSLFQMKNDLLPYSNPYRLRAMATSPEVRGSGAGTAIVEHAIKITRDLGHDVLWCDARAVALGFYDRLGFKTHGDFYNVRNIGPHKLMYYPL
ncbi:MAG: GNAT family N-acetyltransferase [Flavobacteriales bacterium]